MDIGQKASVGFCFNRMSVIMGLSGHKLIKGTLILSLAGFLTRIIGFVYKIYLADMLGAEMLGIYQLVFPVYSICFTIYGAGIQTAISQVIASTMGTQAKKTSPGRVLAAGVFLSMTLACTLTFLFFTQAEWVAAHVALEPSLTPYLRILSILFPFCSLSACINGYYYGIQEAKVPAMTQIVEQIARVVFVMGFSYLFSATASEEMNCAVAVGGLVAGEVVSNLYNSYQLFFRSNFREKCRTYRNSPWASVNSKGILSGISSRIGTGSVFQTLLWLAATLTATKLFVSILHSIESLLLPAMLRKFGCSSGDALSIYGVLTGMSLSFIFFPSTITNSFAVMLLPSIADAHARKDVNKIRHSVTLSVKYSLLIGLLCTCVFLLFGKEMGLLFFHNEDAGSYLTVLSWLCPFLYLGTTLTSIINGMKKTQVTFLFTVISVSLKILILVLAVPVYGIRAYLVGLLVSQLLQVILECGYLFRYIRLDAIRWIAFPGIVLCILGSIAKASYEQVHSWLENQYGIVTLLIAVCLLCVVYTVMLFLLQIISRKDVKTG